MTRWWIAALGVVAVGFIVALLPAASVATDLAAQAKGAGWRGIGLFAVVYLVVAVAALPGAAVTLAAGFAYGPIWGVAVASPTSVLGATVAFVIGRTVLRERMVQLASSRPTMRALDGAFAEEGFKLVCLLRLSPLFPFSLMNYVLSATPVTLATYVTASLIGMLPGTVMYVYLGSALPTAAALASGGPVSPLQTAAYVGGLVATIAAAWLTTRAARRALAARLVA